MLDKVMLNNNFVDYLGQSIEEYQVDKLLVRHAQSARYLAHTSSNKPVFIEILNSSSEQNPELDGRFHQQMHTLMQHPHPGIASILHVGHTAKNHAYAVSQYIAGATLASKLEEWRDADTNLPVLGALHLIKHLAQTLAVVHPLDIFHHDLRPDNIILNKNNILVLIDLGVPYQDKPQQPIKQMNMLDYLSPEQQQGKPINGRNNIYSLGIILYEFLAGHRPKIAISSAGASEKTTFPQAVHLEEVRPGLTAATYELVNSCLWPQEGSHYETIDQFVLAIDMAIAAETPPARLWPSLGNFPRWLYIASALGLLLIGLSSFLLARGLLIPDSVTPLPVTAVATLPPDTPLPQPTWTTAPTQAPTPTSETPILLIAPEFGSEIVSNEAVRFDWSYPIPRPKIFGANYYGSRYGNVRHSNQTRIRPTIWIIDQYS